MLDVAGGRAFTIALCRRHPEPVRTILAFRLVAVARQYVAEAGLQDRVGYIEEMR
jgi:hypothetical protein